MIFLLFFIPNSHILLNREREGGWSWTLEEIEIYTKKSIFNINNADQETIRKWSRLLYSPIAASQGNVTALRFAPAVIFHFIVNYSWGGDRVSLSLSAEPWCYHTALITYYRTIYHLFRTTPLSLYIYVLHCLLLIFTFSSQFWF